MPLETCSLKLVPVLEVMFFFSPDVSEQSGDDGMEISAYLSQPRLRDERVVPGDDVKTLVPLIGVHRQDAAGVEIEGWLSAFRPRTREFTNLLGLYRVECLERDASRQPLIRLF